MLDCSRVFANLKHLMVFVNVQIKCMKCGVQSERQERIMDLAVEIDGNICTLEEALRKFTSTEILDGENKYKCSRSVVFIYMPQTRSMS